MKTVILTCTVGVFCTLATLSYAGQKIPLTQAEAICQDRTEKFENTVFGRFQDTPPREKVKDFYRSCVHAKSGQNPSIAFSSKLYHLFTLKNAG